MSKISLTLAIDDYDHVRDLVNGVVEPAGIDLRPLIFSVEETFYRFAKSFEWEVSELSLAKFCSLRSYDQPPVVGIPVFISRMFRHSAIYIRSDGKITSSAQLKGGRIGIPEWTQTATVYVRGWLQDEGGVPLDSVEWVQAGVNEPGRVEMAALHLPEGVSYAQVPDRALTDMLLEGEIDALISARPPTRFLDGDPGLARLFPKFQEVELDYFRRTGIYPIMHTVAIRRDVYEENRWIARNLMTAFEQARDRSVARMGEYACSKIPFPWMPDHFARTAAEIFPNGEFWPYGIAANRKTLEAFLRFCDEQGVTQRRLAPEDLFAEECQSSFKV